jgi:CubicO group peptidase (beta-lactamase class C family)
MLSVEPFASFVDEMFARGVGSGAALSIGEDNHELVRMFRGSTRRVPTPGEPVTADTWWDVASLTKPIVTVASAMVLAGEGRLDLDAPITEILPGAASRGTVLQLIGHAAGCAAHVEFFKQLRASPPADPRAALVAMAMAVPAIDPGTTVTYSDLGYIQLGAIIERASGLPLEQAYAELVAQPLDLSARYGADRVRSVATEQDERGVVQGEVHDENAWYGGRVCGHAGLFARLDDVVTFAQAILDLWHGVPRGRLQPQIVRRFLSTSAAAAAGATWRLGFDTPSPTPGMSHAGDRWPRSNSAGHMGFTGVSMWLDLADRRWSVLLTNRVHPTRFGESADAIKELRRAVNDAAIDLLERR